MSRHFTLLGEDDPAYYAGFQTTLEYLDPDFFRVTSRLKQIKWICELLLLAECLLIAELDSGEYCIFIGEVTVKERPFNCEPGEKIYALILRDRLVLAVHREKTFHVIQFETGSGVVAPQVQEITEWLAARQRDVRSDSLALSRCNAFWFEVGPLPDKQDYYYPARPYADALSEFLDPFEIEIYPDKNGLVLELNQNVSFIYTAKADLATDQSDVTIPVQATFIVPRQPGYHPELIFLKGKNLAKLIVKGVHYGRVIEDEDCGNHMAYGAQMLGAALLHGLYPRELTDTDVATWANLTLHNAVKTTAFNTTLDFTKES